MNKATQDHDAVLHPLADAYLDRHPGEAAALLETADTGEAAQLLAEVPTGRAREVLRRLTPAAAADVLDHMGAEDAGRLLVSLPANQSAALLARLSPERREERLAHADEVIAAELRELMAYPPDSAGRLMDPRVATFRSDSRVQDVVHRLRAIRRRRLQDIFLVDEDDHLTGSVAIQDVLLAEPESRVQALVTGPPPQVTALAPRDEVLETLERTHARSLPVVDFDGHIVGVLRQEEIVAAAEQEGAQDIVSMVGAGKDERALSPPFFAVRKRLPWLEVNLLTAFLAAAVVGLFEEHDRPLHRAGRPAARRGRPVRQHRRPGARGDDARPGAARDPGRGNGCASPQGVVGRAVQRRRRRADDGGSRLRLEPFARVWRW